MLGTVSKAKPNGMTNVARHVSTPSSRFGWEIDRVFDRILEPWGMRAAETPHVPMPIELIETPEEIVVRAETPGIAIDQLDVHLSGETLTIAGAKEPDEAHASHGYYTERVFGAYRRSIQLPCPVDPDRVEARSKNGVVTVTLSKSELVRPRRIEISHD